MSHGRPPRASETRGARIATTVTNDHYHISRARARSRACLGGDVRIARGGPLRRRPPLCAARGSYMGTGPGTLILAIGVAVGGAAGAAFGALANEPPDGGGGGGGRGGEEASQSGGGAATMMTTIATAAVRRAPFAPLPLWASLVVCGSCYTVYVMPFFDTQMWCLRSDYTLSFRRVRSFFLSFFLFFSRSPTPANWVSRRIQRGHSVGRRKPQSVRRRVALLVHQLGPGVDRLHDGRARREPRPPARRVRHRQPPRRPRPPVGGGGVGGVVVGVARRAARRVPGRRRADGTGLWRGAHRSSVWPTRMATVTTSRGGAARA